MQQERAQAHTQLVKLIRASTAMCSNKYSIGTIMHHTHFICWFILLIPHPILNGIYHKAPEAWVKHLATNICVVNINIPTCKMYEMYLLPLIEVHMRMNSCHEDLMSDDHEQLLRNLIRWESNDVLNEPIVNKLLHSGCVTIINYYLIWKKLG